MTQRIAMLATLTAISITSFQANAYTISTGFTDSCHEFMTIQAVTTNELPTNFQPFFIPEPDSETWEILAEKVIPGPRGTTMDQFGEAGELVLISLTMGVRSPDTEGHSVTNLATLRDAHTNPAGQYQHFLRSTRDDGVDGDFQAIVGSIRFFRDTVQTALAYLKFPPRGQIITITAYADFYGQIKVDVWAPMFYLGVAMHTLQDSFSHTVRSDDLRKIRHVMNFIDAVTTDHKASRDGLAHSAAMDDCGADAEEISLVAIEATQELVNAGANAITLDSMAPIDDFIERWFQYEPGCTAQNNFCDSKWAHIARRDPTGPFIADAFDCTQTSTARPTDPKAAAFFTLLTGAAIMTRRRRRKNRP